MAQLELPLPLDSPLLGKVKNDRRVMAYNFFSLTKERLTELPVYDDGKVRITVTGTKHGVATIWDKEILIYCASLIQEKLNRGEPVTPSLTFTASDFCRIAHILPTGPNYERMHEGLRRLQGTQIETNIESGGKGEARAFSWVSDYAINYRTKRDGGKEMQSVTIVLGEWIYRAILKDGQMLTYNPGYFDLSPLARRLYEIARVHVGNGQAPKRMYLEKLHRRVGSNAPLKIFKQHLIALKEKADKAHRAALLDYHFMVADPKQTFTQDKKRSPLKGWMVMFFPWRSISQVTWRASLIEDDEL